MDFKQENERSNQTMNKKIYMTAIICTLAGLYLPPFMQMPVTLIIFGTFIMFVFTNTKEFFGKKGGKK